jgi:hypothetical protein
MKTRPGADDQAGELALGFVLAHQSDQLIPQGLEMARIGRAGSP